MCHNIVLTDPCAFPVTEHATLSGTVIEFYDGNGALTMILAHVVEVDTMTANGKGLQGLPYHINGRFLFDGDGNLTNQWDTGVYEKIVLPDGSLFVSAGRTDFVAHHVVSVLSPDKGNSGNVAAFCAALSQ
jgi:hypothetical protein